MISVSAMLELLLGVLVLDSRLIPGIFSEDKCEGDTGVCVGESKSLLSVAFGVLVSKKSISTDSSSNNGGGLWIEFSEE